jgi:hypothetical protein
MLGQDDADNCTAMIIPVCAHFHNSDEDEGNGIGRVRIKHGTEISLEYAKITDHLEYLTETFLTS